MLVTSIFNSAPAWSPFHHRQPCHHHRRLQRHPSKSLTPPPPHCHLHRGRCGRSQHREVTALAAWRQDLMLCALAPPPGRCQPTQTRHDSRRSPHAASQLVWDYNLALPNLGSRRAGCRCRSALPAPDRGLPTFGTRPSGSLLCQTSRTSSDNRVPTPEAHSRSRPSHLHVHAPPSGNMLHHRTLCNLCLTGDLASSPACSGPPPESCLATYHVGCMASACCRAMQILKVLHRPVAASFAVVDLPPASD